MIKIALAFDNAGHSNILKGFFHSCANDLKLYLAKHQNDLVEIPGENLNHDKVQQILSPIDNRFFFVTFSHGRHDSLVCGHNPPEYVSLTVNFNLFREAFFYTWSCLSSLSLGEGLIKNHGCAVYWGYRDAIWAPKDPAQQGVFIECANRGLQQFIEGKTVQEARDNAIEYYNDKIDELADENYPLSSRLRINRDAMDVQGSMELSVSDFQY